MSSRPLESPPPYRPDEFKPNHYAPSNDIYGGEMHVRPMLSQPAYSFYPEESLQAVKEQIVTHQEDGWRL
uniref:Isoform 6 of Occludin n=1 Tax=Homo sapiens TaxID=9606 RepID=Q16625-6|nr:occludin splice variant [Homo sapiens]